MKTKQIKAMMLAALLFGFCALAAHDDCYTVWLQAFEGAQEQFDKDKKDCENDNFAPGILYGFQLCLMDANSTFDTSINTAADEYIDCLD